MSRHEDSLAERILLAISPAIVQSEQFRAYETLKDYFEANVKPLHNKGFDDKAFKLALAEFETFRKSHVEVATKNTAVACASLAHAIATEFEAQGGILEQALRRKDKEPEPAKDPAIEVDLSKYRL